MASLRLTFSKESYTEKVPDIRDGEKYHITSNGVIIDSKGTAVADKEVSKPYRTAEIETLKGLAELAANNVKSRKDSFCMMDVADSLANLPADAEGFDLDERDAKNIIDAFESIAGKRPTAWMKYGRGILRQIP